MKKFIKTFLFVALSAVLVVGMAMSASAEKYSSKYNTAAGTAGKWMIQSARSSFTTNNATTIYGGDVGAWYHETNVSLPSAFSRDTNRKTWTELWEEDTGLFTLDQEVKKYEWSFRNSNGKYQPYYVNQTWVKKDAIETDKTPELYLKYNVQSLAADNTKNVAAGLICYQFWMDDAI